MELLSDRAADPSPPRRTVASDRCLRDRLRGHLTMDRMGLGVDSAAAALRGLIRSGLRDRRVLRHVHARRALHVRCRSAVTRSARACPVPVWDFPRAAVLRLATRAHQRRVKTGKRPGTLFATGSSKGIHVMLYWAAVFFRHPLVAAVLGFSGLAAGAAGIAKIGSSSPRPRSSRSFLAFASLCDA